MKRPSEEQIAGFNEKHSKEVAEQYKEFKKDLAQGICWVCKQPIDSFDESLPCQHWLLLPKGFRKKHFKKVFETCTYDKIEGFLRWYVNAHEPMRHINDLVEEHDGSKVKALTIKFQNLEWSFSFSKGCIEGGHGPHGPHYHFQMRKDELPLHNYSSRHIKLSDYELWLLEIEQDKHPFLRKKDGHGMGMQGLLDNADPEELLSTFRNAENDDTATFHTHSMVIADDGHTISGDDIADMLEESRRTGTPMHQLIKKLKNVKTTVYIEPGPGVPLPAQRKRVRVNRKKK